MGKWDSDKDDTLIFGRDVSYESWMNEFFKTVPYDSFLGSIVGR